MEEIRSGRLPFCRLDVLHRHNLERILPRFDVSGLTEETLRNLNLAWHRLDAWPDVPPGMAALKRKFWLAPVSNGNISLMVDLARRNTIPWDAILGSEIAGDFKPKPRVYLSACEAFDLRARRLHDGRRPQQRSLACGEERAAHRPYCAAERAWAGQGRAGAEGAGRCRGVEPRRSGAQARRVTRDRAQYGRTAPFTVVRSISRRSVEGKSVRACEE